MVHQLISSLSKQTFCCSHTTIIVVQISINDFIHVLCYPDSMKMALPLTTNSLVESFITSSSTAILPTTAIRPQGVFGDNDTSVIPTILSIPRNIDVSSGNNLYDFTYAPNVARAPKTF
ncbi:hypothetical protein V1505DRAFT_238030 [Lipomyces doorenjongii]